MENRAFTLVELLVVLVIISVLARMLLPALAASRAQARSVVCTNHLKQIFTSATLYQADFGFYPLHYLPNSVTNPEPSRAWGSEGYIGAYLDGVIEITRCPEINGYYNSPTPVISYGAFWAKATGGALTPQGIRFAGAAESNASGNPLYGDSLRAFVGAISAMQFIPPFWGLQGDVNLFADSVTNGIVGGTDISYFVPVLGALDRRHRGQGQVIFLDGHMMPQRNNMQF